MKKFSVRLDEADKKLSEKLAMRYKIPVSDIIGYGLELIDKHKLMEIQGIL